MNHLIRFENVTKKYDNGTVALKDVNLQIDPGEFVFVVGASGAGKSTFLKLMMREEVPSHGSIQIGDWNLNDLSRRKIPLFRRTLGVVFQDFRLIANMTVYDNIAFAMRVIGAREKDIRKRVPYVIAMVGLASKARCYPEELSGGEQQRVALARALTNNAEILIADEPTGNVDPQMSYEIVELLMRLNNKGTTVIMVTHEHSLVKQFDKRVIILEDGAVAADGKPFHGDVEESSRKHLQPNTPTSADEDAEAKESDAPQPAKGAAHQANQLLDAEDIHGPKTTALPPELDLDIDLDLDTMLDMAPEDFSESVMKQDVKAQRKDGVDE